MIDKDYFRYFTTVEVSLPFLPEWYSRRFYVQITPGEHDGYNVESSKAKIAERPNFAFQVTQPIENCIMKKEAFLGIHPNIAFF